MPSGDRKVEAARPAVDRVLDRCVEDGACWIWTGASAGRGRHKYGRVTVGSRRDGSRRSRGTHEVVYEALVGPIPEGCELDHFACRRTLCCNPWHLDPVPHRVNCQRMALPADERARRSAHMRRVNDKRWH